MKQVAILAFLFVSFTASAQTAAFKGANAMQPAGIHTQFNCTVADLTSAEQLQTIVTRMKATPGLLKLDVLDVTPTSARFIVITNQAQNVSILENAFSAAGIEAVTYDDRKLKTNKLHTVIAAQ